jgi:hypothetical protein
MARSGRDLVPHPAKPIAERASFTAVKELQEHIDAFIRIYNDKAEPFVWTKKKVPTAPIQRPPYHSALIPGTSPRRIPTT